MKKKIARKWSAALRSGKYKQTKTKLRADGEFCAVGVLYELYRKEKKIPSKKFWDQFYTEDQFYKENTLFKKLQKWAGLRTDDFAWDLYRRFIVVENDRGADFNLLADMIDDNFDKL